MNIAHWLARSAVRHATRPALMLGSEVLCDYAKPTSLKPGAG